MELAASRAFEVLRSARARVDYLLCKEARIVAMTTTHAALARTRMINLGFRFDTLIMEEAAQVTEIESFLPLACNAPDANAAARKGVSHLQRVVLIGDHHQLPPVVRNATLARFSRLDQSLFARLIRVGVPHVVLDAQGRARPSLSALYAWRYAVRGADSAARLGDMADVVTTGAFARANAGFAFDAQLIDVDGDTGGGESTPSPFFYQNVAEAEFVVSVYEYMRRVGYPAGSIVLLTTYNGQKALLRDVLRARAHANPSLGEPAAVETVDRFQGQQADYVLLSLVRTRAVGHVRDVRRIVVALSRARLGLYIHAHTRLFHGALELAPALSQLAARPAELELVGGEACPAPGFGLG